MTVRTENSQVLEPIVEPVTIDVIELDRNPTIGTALRPAAKLTLRTL
jgi:hypothetical protein